MASKITAAAHDPLMTQIQPAAPARSEPPAAQDSDPVEMRLIIEVDQASGTYIYKTVNRMTGEVVQQLPRAEVLKLGGAQYTAGAVVRTKA